MSGIHDGGVSDWNWGRDYIVDHLDDLTFYSAIDEGVYVVGVIKRRTCRVG